MKNIKAQYVGLLTGACMIAASLLSFYVLKLPIESNFQLVIYALFSGGISLSLFNYYKTEEGKKAFKDYFATGFKTFITVTLLMAAFAFIFFSFNTAFRDQKIAENSKAILAEGNHLPQEIEENAKQLKKLFLPLMISSAVFRYLIIGALVTAIGSGYLSSKQKMNKI